MIRRLAICMALVGGVPSVTMAQAADKVANDAPVVLTLDGQTHLEVIAIWEQIAESVYGLHNTYPQLQNFAPAREKATYDSDAFKPFLPPKSVAVGDTWKVDAGDALPFLRQFHEGATASLHHGSGSAPGAWACLRALSARYAEVLIRVHAEFVLVEGQGYGSTSWLTPAQFEGRLVIDRERGVVESFQLRLPSRNGNIDVNVPFKPDPEQGGHAHAGMIVADIGFIPRMELLSEPTQEESASYDEEISLDEARLKLARKFYPFASIEWRELPAALAEAQREGIPLHIVALFGALDDESC